MDQTSLAAKPTTPNLELSKPRKQYTGTAAKLMKLMASGATQEEASKACGVDASLTSQYMSEPDFKEQLVELIAKSFAEANQIDNNYQAIEKNMSERLLKLTEFMMNPDQVLRVLKFANEAKRKTIPQVQPQGLGISGDGTVKILPALLLLPNVMTREFVLNPNNEVVGIDGKELTTLNSTSLNKLIENKRDSQLKLQNREVPVKHAPKSTRNEGDPYSDL